MSQLSITDAADLLPELTARVEATIRLLTAGLLGQVDPELACQGGIQLLDSPRVRFGLSAMSVPTSGQEAA